MVDVILTRRAEFSAFATYISDYDRSMSVLEESCRQNKAFEDVVKQFEVRSWEFMADCIYDEILYNAFFWHAGFRRINVINSVKSVVLSFKYCGKRYQN